MSNIFENKAYIPFITAGYPNLETTKNLIIEMAKNGADIIQVALPFSDPVADAECTALTFEETLSKNITTDEVFNAIEEARKETDVKIALYSYTNTLYVYGKDKFFSKMQSLNIDYVIVPDIPVEEKDEFLPYCEKYGVSLIFMITPTSINRIKLITENASGFLYCIPPLGFSYNMDEIESFMQTVVNAVKDVKDIPVAFAFGISNTDHISRATKICDGIISGPELVQIMVNNRNDCIKPVCDYVKNIKSAMN